MQAVEQVATIESLQAKLNELQAQQSEARQGVDAAKVGIASLSEQRKSLLIKGDAASLAEVLKLEATLKDLGRTQEACQFRFDALASQITDVQQPLLALQQKAMENQRIQKTEELSQEAARLAHNKHALWRAASRAAFAEAEFHAKVVPTAGVSQSQQAQIRQVGIDAHDHRGDAFNEKWARGFVFVANLTVEPLCPPDDLRHLEVLK
jgi:chromosome segregation ATPase